MNGVFDICGGFGIGLLIGGTLCAIHAYCDWYYKNTD